MANLLTEETLKIVIAVICIGFLVGFLISLYFNHTSSQNLEFAKASLKHLDEQINIENTEVEIYNPAGWFLVSWPKEYNAGWGPFQETKEGMPKTCTNIGLENCICICKNDNPDECDKNGFCLGGMWNIHDEEKNHIKIQNPPLILEINYDTGEITKK